MWKQLQDPEVAPSSPSPCQPAARLPHPESSRKRDIPFMSLRLSFDSHRDGVTTAETQSGNPAMHVAADHFVNQSDQHSSATCADGMADGHGSTVHVDLVRI